MPGTRQPVTVALVLGAAIGASGLLGAQALVPYRPASVTATDYDRAVSFLAAGVAPRMRLAAVRPTWRPDGSFWYRSPDGNTVLIDPRTARRTACSDCSADDAQTPARPRAEGPPAVLSPDRQRAAFVRDFNLWVRDEATGRERQLTSDGVPDFAYATNNAGWIRSDTPVLLWSPDSTKIATFRHDGRTVGTMAMVGADAARPTVDVWKYPLPGDESIFEIERVVIDVPSGRVTRLAMAPDPHRSSVCDHVVCAGRWADVEWAADGRSLAFVSTSRDHKVATLRVADAATGAVRDVLTERAATFVETGNQHSGDLANWRYLPSSNEVIWYSTRDNWGQLYLYDLGTGALKRQITSGEGNVAQVVRVDESARQIWFWGMGREAGRDPYYRHLYRIGMDGTGLTLLTPAVGNHTVSWSPDNRYIIDTYSTPSTPPVVELRDADTGVLVMPLETSDISALQQTGWKPPVSFSVTCRDGVSRCFGLLYEPFGLDPSRKYPVINYIYPGPSGSIGSRSFSASRGDNVALAALGFAVVQIDGMGTDGRSKAFYDVFAGNLADNTLPDQVAGMQELGRRYPWLDLDRVGIWGHSGGGFATAGALLRYPDFFKVGIAESGNHDNRAYEDDWAEKWQGLLAGDRARASYTEAANQTLASRLTGKLLLAHGGLDDNVPIVNTYLLVDALVKANKDFDLVVFPNAGHGYGVDRNYMMRKRWDYFVRWLHGVEPPKEYLIR